MGEVIEPTEFEKRLAEKAAKDRELAAQVSSEADAATADQEQQKEILVGTSALPGTASSPSHPANPHIAVPQEIKQITLSAKLRTLPGEEPKIHIEKFQAGFPKGSPAAVQLAQVYQMVRNAGFLVSGNENKATFYPLTSFEYVEVELGSILGVQGTLNVENPDGAPVAG
jgi:hypothetical protein